MNIGEKIKAARLAKGWTQEELGLRVGLQKSAIAKYEKNRVVNIKRSTLQKLASCLGMRGSDLIIEEENTKVAVADDLSELERAFIARLRLLPEEKQKALLDFLEANT